MSLSCSNFRRTKFGNGQFAVLVLCLTVADILTVFCGLLGKYSTLNLNPVKCIPIKPLKNLLDRRENKSKKKLSIAVHLFVRKQRKKSEFHPVYFFKMFSIEILTCDLVFLIKILPKGSSLEFYRFSLH
jgi:hypothetical protein